MAKEVDRNSAHSRHAFSVAQRTRARKPLFQIGMMATKHVSDQMISCVINSRTHLYSLQFSARLPR